MVNVDFPFLLQKGHCRDQSEGNKDKKAPLGSWYIEG